MACPSYVCMALQPAARSTPCCGLLPAILMCIPCPYRRHSPSHIEREDSIMSNATQHFTDGYAASFPSKDGNNSYSSTALTKNLIRKSVEHAGWLIDMKKKDILQLIDDKIQLEGADQISDDKLVIIVAKYGAARGGVHNTDLAGERIDQRIESIDSEIEMLADYITAQKAAFKECTGDAFTASAKKPTTVKRPTKAKLQGIMEKYAAQAAE